MANQFILCSVPGHRPLQAPNFSFTDLDGHPVQLNFDEIAEIHRQWSGLLPSRLSAVAACELLARIAELPGITEVQESGSTNARTDTGAHAEENLVAAIAPTMLANHNQATVSAMFVSLEPCHSNRYRGHGCKDFFRPAGRTYAGVPNARFVPGKRWTPIFIFQKQLPKGEKSAWGMIKASGKDMREATLKEAMIDTPAEAAKEHRWFGKEQQQQSSSQGGTNQARVAAPAKSSTPVKSSSTSKTTAPLKTSVPVRTSAPVKTSTPVKTSAPVKTTSSSKTAAPAKKVSSKK